MMPPPPSLAAPRKRRAPIRRRVFGTLAALLLPFSALAAGKACGTVVVPPGVGLGTPPATVDSLNPFFANSLYDSQAAALLYAQLLWITRNHTIDFSRSLAQSINVSKGNTVFTVTMKHRNWSDGVPVTARDAQYTFDMIKKLGNTYLQYGVGGVPTLIKSFTILGPYQFQVTLKHSVNPVWFELTGLNQFQPFPAHVWAKYSINQMWRLQSSPSFYKVVDGPYMIDRYIMGRYISFRPNPTYQGHRSQIERFVFSFLNGDGAVIEGLKKGTIDAGNRPFDLWQASASLKDIRTIKLTPNYGFDFMSLNFKNPNVAFFRDVRVRDAMADAINQQQMIHVVLHDTTHQQYGPVPVDPPAFLSPEARAGQYPVGYDPAKARQLLDATGWKKGPDGIRVKDGKRLEFNYLAQSGNVTAVLDNQLEQADLRAVGIRMNIREMTFNQLLAMIEKPLQWEATGFGWSLGAYPDNSVQFETGGGQNQAGYSNKKMDRLLAAVTTDSGMQALYAYQNYASAQQPEIFLPAPGVEVLVRHGLRGVRKAISPIGLLSPQYLHWTTPPCGTQSVASK